MWSLGEKSFRAVGGRGSYSTLPIAQHFVDEVGYLASDARAADLLFQLVSRRYEHRSLLITTNLPFKRWDTVFPNASCAVALIDRLTHHVEILVMVGTQRADHPALSIPALLDRLERTHGVRLHRRTVERIVGGGPRKKNAAGR